MVYRKGYTICFTLSLLFLFLATIASAAPHAVIHHRDFYAGIIPQGKVVIHEFTIKNTGDKPLILDIGHT